MPHQSQSFPVTDNSSSNAPSSKKFSTKKLTTRKNFEGTRYITIMTIISTIR